MQAHQNWFTSTWNRATAYLVGRRSGPKLNLGYRASGDAPGGTIGLPVRDRFEHIAILGRTGTGKTSLLRHLCRQDIQAGHGFAFFDLHGDTTPFLLGLIAEEEKRRGIDLSARTILIDPADRERSVGINILETIDDQDAFVEIAETVQILRHRWKLDALGVRTDELLRNTLFILMANRLTFLDIGVMLTNESFRSQCLRRASKGEARSYFEDRFDLLSPQNQAVYREAILNKVSLYAADPHFRHLLGQTKSTINLKKALDSGAFLLFNLEKGRLGEEGATLAALLLAKLKHAILGRETRRMFTLYCDELQNLVAYDSAIDVLLSEARKFGIGIVTANQYLDQYPPGIRAAILAIRTHVFFQLSGPDAARVSYVLGRGNQTAEKLRTLSKRHALIKLSDQPLVETKIPETRTPRIIPVSLLRRSRARFTRSRTGVEQEIVDRQRGSQPKEVYEQWT